MGRDPAGGSVAAGDRARPAGGARKKRCHWIGRAALLRRPFVEAATLLAARSRPAAAVGGGPARSLRSAYCRLRRVKGARPAQPGALPALDPPAAAIWGPGTAGPGQGCTRPQGRSWAKTARIRCRLPAARRGEWPETPFAAGTFGRPGHSPRGDRPATRTRRGEGRLVRLHGSPVRSRAGAGAGKRCTYVHAARWCAGRLR